MLGQNATNGNKPTRERLQEICQFVLDNGKPYTYSVVSFSPASGIWRNDAYGIRFGKVKLELTSNHSVILYVEDNKNEDTFGYRFEFMIRNSRAFSPNRPLWVNQIKNELINATKHLNPLYTCKGM